MCRRDSRILRLAVQVNLDGQIHVPLKGPVDALHDGRRKCSHDVLLSCVSERKLDRHACTHTCDAWHWACTARVSCL
jgi:hypothetical protein